MARKAYIGVDGLARKIKKGYIGVETEVPIYEESTTSLNINGSNIDSIFTVDNDGYYFGSEYADNSIFCSNNWGGEYEDGEEYDDTSIARTVLTALKDIDISFTYSYSSEANWDKFYLTVGDAIIENGASGATTVKEYSGHIDAGTQIEFRYEKDGSVNGYDDECRFYNMVVTYIDAVQTGTELKSVARRIKKAYIGIGGIARPCWGSYKLEYYGTATSLWYGQTRLAATTVGDYALFGGGYNPTNGYISKVDAYDKSLTVTYPSSFRNSRDSLAATTVGDYAIFGGGYKGAGISFSSEVDIYDKSLTKITSSNIALLNTLKRDLAATTVGNYALFGGGYEMGTNADFSTSSSLVEAYDTSLTKTIPTALSLARALLAATTVGNYALFGGGSGASAIVDAYDTSLTRTLPTELSFARDDLAATTVGNYALFGGGSYFTNTFIATNKVDAYDTSLTRTLPTELSKIRSQLAATTVGDYALFGGGTPYPSSSSNAKTDAVDAYDIYLTKTIPTELSVKRANLAATTVGNYALFGGGYNNAAGSSSLLSYSAAVDAYTIT